MSNSIKTILNETTKKDDRLLVKLMFLKPDNLATVDFNQFCKNIHSLVRSNEPGFDLLSNRWFNELLLHLDLPEMKTTKQTNNKSIDVTDTSLDCTNLQKKIETWDIKEERRNFGGELIVVASLIDRMPNLGGLSRTCEVFGVSKYILSNALLVKHNEYRNLSMSSENWVETEQVKVAELLDYIRDMKTKGYRVVCAEQTADSLKLEQFQFPKKCVLVLGLVFFCFSYFL